MVIIQSQPGLFGVALPQPYRQRLPHQFLQKIYNHSEHHSNPQNEPTGLLIVDVQHHEFW